MYDLDYIKELHKFSKGKTNKTGSAGCFFCCACFDASEAVVHEDRRTDCLWCPVCDIDSVLCESDSGAHITPLLMEAMNKYWFGRGSGKGLRITGHAATRLG